MTISYTSHCSVCSNLLRPFESFVLTKDLVVVLSKCRSTMLWRFLLLTLCVFLLSAFCSPRTLFSLFSLYSLYSLSSLRLHNPILVAPHNPIVVAPTTSTRSLSYLDNTNIFINFVT